MEGIFACGGDTVSFRQGGNFRIYVTAVSDLISLVAALLDSFP